MTGRRWGTVGILAANGLSAVLALAFGWDATEVLAVFWWQSVIIGAFAVLRLLTLPLAMGPSRPASSPDNQSEAAPSAAAPGLGPPSLPEKLARVFLAGFFVLHYGGFHAVYLAFLDFPQALAGNPSGFAEIAGIVLAALVPALAFVPGHLASYLADLRGGDATPGTMQEAFTAPYTRIMPMHLTIILGGFLASFLPSATGARGILLLFMALKTWADLRGHARQHAAPAREG